MIINNLNYKWFLNHSEKTITSLPYIIIEARTSVNLEENLEQIANYTALNIHLHSDQQSFFKIISILMNSGKAYLFFTTQQNQ